MVALTINYSETSDKKDRRKFPPVPIHLRW